MKRITALLLSAALLINASVFALAEENDAVVTDDFGAEEHVSDEAYGTRENALTTESPAVGDNPLLITGGHKTYMNGYEGGLFKPDKVMTRSEAARMLYNLLASKPAVSSSPFPDVSLKAWYGTAVCTLSKLKIINGYTDGTFNPEGRITRAEFVTALTKCFTMEGATASFSDVPETHWAYKQIAAATSMGWINGMGDGTFAPDKGLTRAQAVTIMNNALGRKDGEFAADREIQKFKDVPKSHWAYLQVTEAAEPVDSPPVEEPDPEPPVDDPTPQPPAELKVGGKARVTATGGLNLRSGPDTSYSIVTVLTYGDVLTVTELTETQWIGVSTSSGRTGYVSSEYVEAYVPGEVGSLSISNTSVTLKQYQTVRVDGSISSGSLSNMKWESSDPNIAYVGYTLNYGASRTQGAMIYGKKAGTCKISFVSPSGTKATCSVTVGAPEPVRYAFPSENCAVKGVAFDLVAVTDTSRTSVTFSVTGPNNGNFTTSEYEEESRTSTHGLPVNTVRVFKKSVTFPSAGTYTVKAKASGSSTTKDFTVLVRANEESVLSTSTAERRPSTTMLNIIARFEGKVPEVLDDDLVSGNPTVGYGVVIQKGECFYNNLTNTELFAMLVDKANNGGYTAAVNKFRANNNLKMSQAQFDALVSFVFNCGTGTLNTAKYDMPRVMLNMVKTPDLSESRALPGTVNIGDIVAYKEAKFNSAKLGIIPKGAVVTITEAHTIPEKSQIWYKIAYNGNTGWAPAGYISVNTSGLVHDLAYADAASLANNILQWHKASSKCYPGLLYRRNAECKVFFFGNYDEAVSSHPNYKKNTYGFNYPSCEKSYE